MDLKITRARLLGQTGLWDIGIEGGRITAVGDSVETPATTTVDAAEKLVLPGLVDGHIHLDKALILERHPAITGSFKEAMDRTLEIKKTFSQEDIQTRGRLVLERAIAFGITAMRSHVEVDPSIA